MDFWVSTVDDEKVLEFYQDWIVKVANLDSDTPLEVIHFHTEQWCVLKHTLCSIGHYWGLSFKCWEVTGLKRDKELTQLICLDLELVLSS